MRVPREVSAYCRRRRLEVAVLAVSIIVLVGSVLVLLCVSGRLG